MVSKAQLTAVKAYMRIDGDADDAVIKAMYKAAVRYLKSIGIEEPSEDPSLYNLAVWSLTLHYYDHRDAVGSEAGIPTGLQPIISQLKLDCEIARSVSQQQARALSAGAVPFVGRLRLFSFARNTRGGRRQP